ncbi:DUF6527 family protein [Gryllotalpicola koreensis]|uniref:Uncharacterized protein n=1 Tax=Gryllotalpicola koreensis TaxID=993086 RepID=A0ABP7ZQJ9_9MICO
MTASHLRPQFVELIPAQLAEGVLYISTQYKTAVHLCPCGCGNRSVTPISPAQWALKWDGAEVSLWPSVGNWGFPCKSHYVIRDGRVHWASRWTEAQIERGAQRDRADRQSYYRAVRRPAEPDASGWRRHLPGFLRTAARAIRSHPDDS